MHDNKQCEVKTQEMTNSAVLSWWILSYQFFTTECTEVPLIWVLCFSFTLFIKVNVVTKSLSFNFWCLGIYRNLVSSFVLSDILHWFDIPESQLGSWPAQTNMPDFFVLLWLILSYCFLFLFFDVRFLFCYLFFLKKRDKHKAWLTISTIII